MFRKYGLLKREKSTFASKAVGYQKKWSFNFQASSASERYLWTISLIIKLPYFKDKQASLLRV